VKLLFDQNLSPKLVKQLSDLFPGSRHVQDEALDLADDEVVWEFAKQNDFIIVSKDEDYSSLSVLKGSPPKLLWIIAGNCRTSTIHALLRNKFLEIDQFAVDPNAGVLLLG
jgi:predicted nuclease of predicted toxin-antitoxin system